MGKTFNRFTKSLKSCSVIAILISISTVKISPAEEVDFDYTFKSLPSITVGKPADSTQNPNNDFLFLPKYWATLDLRLDLSLEYDVIRLIARPRLILEWERWEEGSRDGETDTDARWYFYEYQARARLGQAVYLSVGKEFLQWGPSYRLSPSNPFFRDNGLINPKREIQGKGFAKCIWVPSSSWSVSLLANLYEGRRDQIRLEEFFDDFERTYAIKLDYTGYRKYFSLIPSYRRPDNDEGDVDDGPERIRLGAYAGWTVSDAFLLYGEGVGFLRTEALYPVADSAAPYGIEMRPTKANENNLNGIGLLGASYTLEIGPTFTVEYIHNSAGYDDDLADRYYELRKRAADTFFSPEPLASLSKFALSRTLNTRLQLLRKNYIMGQYLQVQIWDVLDLILRYTYNLDDNSSQLNPIIEYFVGDHVELFLVGLQNFGSKESEFRSLFDYSWMFGVEVTF
jgi:hypothetical protein